MSSSNRPPNVNGAGGPDRIRSSGHAHDVAILGGGVAGLASGLELARRGWRVTVLERGSEVGGLARTIEHGDFRFDIGGHRFHSHNARVLRWVQALLGDDLLRVERRSHIYLQDRYVSYPLQFPGALRIFSPRQLLRVLSSYAAARWRQRWSGSDARSFESWVVQRFGRELFEIYFRPYTEKVWGIPCSELSADWAAQRITVPNLAQTVRRTLAPGRRPPPTLISSFYYPRYGFGMIPARIAQALQEAGGRLLTGATVTGIQPHEGAYTITYQTEDGERDLRAGQVISTLPLDVLLRALPPDPVAPAGAGLDYRDLICVFLAIDQPQVSRDHWTYFPQRELTFGRTHEPGNWSAAMTPAGMTSLVAEIFTARNEEIWQWADDTIAKQTISQLATMRRLSPARVVDSRVLRVKNAYPLYRIGYEAKLQQARSYLAQFPGLHLAGRTGAFRYLNSDGVLEDVLALVDWLAGNAPRRSDVYEQYVVH